MGRGTLPSLNTKIVLNVQLMVIQLQLTDGLVSMQRVLLKDLFLYWVSKTRLSNVQRPTCLEVKGKTTQPPKFLVRLFIHLQPFLSKSRRVVSPISRVIQSTGGS